MSEDALPGYRGKLRDALDKAGTRIGDLIKVETKKGVYEGTLMPRLETSDDWHLVLKLISGYNIGIAFENSVTISRLGQAEKPIFRPPPLPEVKRGRLSLLGTYLVSYQSSQTLLSWTPIYFTAFSARTSSMGTGLEW